MKIIQTLYTTSKNPFADSFGWISPQYHLISWALSCLLIKKHFGNVELFANSPAANLLGEILELPYSQINVTHDKLELVHDNLWALPKLYTYSIQDQPFLHIDGDVFLFRKISNRLLKGELIAQNIEEATEYYLSTQKELTKYFHYFPDCVSNDFDSKYPIKAVNAGILGGNNIPFIKEYSGLAFEYVSRNEAYLSSINVDKFNVFFEQHLFYALAKEQNIPISLQFDNVVNDNGYKFLGNFHEVPFARTYLHLLGNYKKDEFACQQMASKLRELYPEYFFRILDFCNRKKIVPIYYFLKNEKIDSLKDFKLMLRKASNNYRNQIKIESSVSQNLRGETFEINYPDLKLFPILYEKYARSVKNSDKTAIRQDNILFVRNLLEVLARNHTLSHNYLFGRDIDFANWYNDLFHDENFISEKVIQRCDDVDVVKSKYNWSELFLKLKCINSPYYSKVQMKHGNFFSLVIPEINIGRFSLYDLDYFEQLILEEVAEPVSIKELQQRMQSYATKDVIENHLDVYNNYLIKLIKSLVLKKAIRPKF